MYWGDVEMLGEVAEERPGEVRADITLDELLALTIGIAGGAGAGERMVDHADRMLRFLMEGVYPR